MPLEGFIAAPHDGMEHGLRVGGDRRQAWLRDGDAGPPSYRPDVWAERDSVRRDDGHRRRMNDAERPFLIGLSWPPRGGASLGWETIVRG